MSQTTTIEIFPQTPFNSTNLVSDRVPAAGYYISKKDFQTFTWNLTDVTGLFTLQATLVEVPEEADWFTVHTIECSNTTEINYVNIRGNFVWLRAEMNSFSTGVIQYVKVSY